MVATVNTVLFPICRTKLVNTDTTRIVAPANLVRFYTKICKAVGLYTLYRVWMRRTGIWPISLEKLF